MKPFRSRRARRATAAFGIIGVLALLAGGTPTAELDEEIRVAVAAYAESVRSCEQAELDAIRQATSRRIATYESRLSDHTRTGNFDKVRAISAKLDAYRKEAAVLEAIKTPKNLVTYQGHFYAYIPQARTWHEAQQACEYMGGHLAYLETTEELEFVKTFSKEGPFWLGATDEAEEGVWSWADGRRVTLPIEHLVDNSLQMEHYLTLDPVRGLNDLPNTRTPFLCEWDR